MALLYGLPLLFGSVGSWFVGSMLEEEPTPAPSFDTSMPDISQQPMTGYEPTPSFTDGLGFQTPQPQLGYDYQQQPGFAEQLGLVPSRYSRPSYGYYSPSTETSFWNRPSTSMFSSQPQVQPQPSAPVQNVYAPQQGFFTSMFQRSPTESVVTPEITKPSVAPEVAPEIAQPSVAPEIAQPSVAPEVAPEVRQPSVAPEVTPSIQQPSTISEPKQPSILNTIQSAVASILPETATTLSSTSRVGSAPTEVEIKPFGPRDMKECGKEDAGSEETLEFQPRDMRRCSPNVSEPTPQENTPTPTRPAVKQDTSQSIQTRSRSISVPSDRRIHDLPNY